MPRQIKKSPASSSESSHQEKVGESTYSDDPYLQELEMLLADSKRQQQEVGRRALNNLSIFPGKEIENTYSIESPEDDFELTMTEALHGYVKEFGFARARHAFSTLIQGIEESPLGETNIDAFADTDAGRTARLVHKVIGPLEGLVPGKELALKGTGLDMEQARTLGDRTNLRNQFRYTLRMNQLFNERLPDGAIDGIMRMNEVYGVISSHEEGSDYPKEWMLMEYIPNAQPVDNEELTHASLSGNSKRTLGFSREKYPDLAAIVDRADPLASRFPSEFIQYKELAVAIAAHLKVGEYSSEFSILDDLNGNNILRSIDEDGKAHYTIIDVQPHDFR